MKDILKNILRNTLMLMLCCLCTAVTNAATIAAANDSTLHRKKVGVVLSGGGAKGVAHIGALKVIREAGIPIDIIAGTSMGSIVGGLTALGYSPQQLDSLVRAQNWSFLLSDKTKRSEQSMEERYNSDTYVISMPLTKNMKAKGAGGVIKGLNLGNLFQDLTIGYHEATNFDSLPIPFACVAEDVVNGEKIVFHNGVLATAMRSSMAIPGVFTPVRMDNMVLIDGGMIDNYPVDVARAMGADIIIGVDVQNELRSADKLNGTGDILGQIINLTGLEIYKENIEKTDLYIHVDVDGYSAASFTANAIDTLLARGEYAARDTWESMIELKRQIGLPLDYVASYPEYHIKRMDEQTIPINYISFSGPEDVDVEWLLRKCRLNMNDTVITKLQLNDAISRLRSSQAYSSVNYKLTRADNNRYNLDFMLEEKKERNVNLGVRFDSEEIASTIINVNTRVGTRVPSKASLTGRLGKRYMAKLEYTIEPMQNRNFNMAYQFEYNDINVYNKGVKSYNTIYKYHLGEFSFSDLWFHNLRFSFGVRMEYFMYKDMLSDVQLQGTEIKPEHLFSYFGSVHYGSLDSNYFPTRGSELKAGYSLYTDNFSRYKDGMPFSAVNASWLTAFSVNPRFAIIPSIYGRVLIGNKVAYSELNFIGGNYFGRFVSQQMPFAGINHMEMVERSTIIASVKVRQKILDNNYISLTGNVFVAHNNFFNLLNDGRCRFGVAAGYAYNSMFGPLEAILGYSNQSREASFYINLGFYF